MSKTVEEIYNHFLEESAQCDIYNDNPKRNIHLMSACEIPIQDFKTISNDGYVSCHLQRNEIDNSNFISMQTWGKWDVTQTDDGQYQINDLEIYIESFDQKYYVANTIRHYGTIKNFHVFKVLFDVSDISGIQPNTSLKKSNSDLIVKRGDIIDFHFPQIEAIKKESNLLSSLVNQYYKISNVQAIDFAKDGFGGKICKLKVI